MVTKAYINMVSYFKKKEYEDFAEPNRTLTMMKYKRQNRTR